MEIRVYGIGAFLGSRMKLRMRQFVLLVQALVLAFPTASWAAAPAQEPGQGPVTNGGYYGIYRIAQDHFVGIDRYIEDTSGGDAVLISDCSNGIVRRLFPISDTEFVMGPGFEVREPAEPHGSGPLTRYSFGPYPHFFTSLGFAVLIHDKRGTGSSTGALLDASTGALTLLPAAYYPDDLTFRCVFVVSPCPKCLKDSRSHPVSGRHFAQ
jgi:hypothetical protein